MPDRRNIVRAQRFRERIELYLNSSDLDVTIPQPHKGRDKSQAGDVHGLRAWTVLVRSDFSHDWSGDLDKAREAARRDGKPLSAVIGFRTGDRKVSEQYVMLDLQTFAAVLWGEHVKASTP